MTPSELLDWRLALGSMSAEEYKRASACLSSPSPVPNPILAVDRNGEMARDDMQMHLQLFTIFREYVKHEDSLINWRLSWNFTIQGFLFAAYALAKQKIVENGQLAHEAINHFVILLAGIGMFVTVITFFGVHAATTAIAELDKRWRSVHTLYDFTAEHNVPPQRSRSRWWRRPSRKMTHGPNLPGLPGIVGGGVHLFYKGLGLWSARLLPWVFFFAWIVALWFWPR